MTTTTRKKMIHRQSSRISRRATIIRLLLHRRHHRSRWIVPCWSRKRCSTSLIYSAHRPSTIMSIGSTNYNRSPRARRVSMSSITFELKLWSTTKIHTTNLNGKSKKIIWNTVKRISIVETIHCRSSRFETIVSKWLRHASIALQSSCGLWKGLAFMGTQFVG